MTEYIAALQNGRNVPKEDKIFGISSRAKAMAAEKGADAVVNATIGTLLDDEGKLIVLSSVAETFSGLTAEDYAGYAPIGGIPSYKKAAVRAALGAYQPKGFTEVCATPGGTGAIRNTIANYSAPGDRVLTGDWHWSPYGTIASEIGRKIDTFTMFTEERNFNIDALCEKAEEILKEQSHLVIILNTPAHNPTGYALSDEEWRRITASLSELPGEKRIALLIDAAYIDFAGDEEEYRSFLPIIEELPGNVLPIIAYSMSKTFTLYGMRTGAALCLAKTKEIAEEFRRVFEFSSRGSWSNCAKAGQSIIAAIYENELLLSKVTEERKEIRDMLLSRGRAFEEAAEEAGLEIVPFDAGFFVSVPCENPEEVSRRLEKEGIFLVPLAKGLRVSVASVSEKVCRALPERILSAMK